MKLRVEDSDFAQEYFPCGMIEVIDQSGPPIAFFPVLGSTPEHRQQALRRAWAFVQTFES